MIARPSGHGLAEVPEAISTGAVGTGAGMVGAGMVGAGMVGAGTVGAGVETALSSNWFARAEYRYADFGSSAFTIIRSSSFASLNPTIDNFNVALRTHTATFGLAYKFW